MMTNVSATPEKVETRAFLFDTAIKALEKKGWKVERIPGAGKASLRLISKSGVAKKVTIRTTQNTWFAFPRNVKNDGWATLEDADFVVAASVDDADDPKFAKIHMFTAAEMTDRFDRAYAARSAAGHSMPPGRGIWIGLYREESSDPVTLVGAGAGLKNEPISVVPLATGAAQPAALPAAAEATESEEKPLTIAEAKRRLALTFGVEEADIKIIING